MMRAYKVCLGQILCKDSDSQVSKTHRHIFQNILTKLVEREM